MEEVIDFDYLIALFEEHLGSCRSRREEKDWIKQISELKKKKCKFLSQVSLDDDGV